MLFTQSFDFPFTCCCCFTLYLAKPTLLCLISHLFIHLILFPGDKKVHLDETKQETNQTDDQKPPKDDKLPDIDGESFFLLPLLRLQFCSLLVFLRMFLFLFFWWLFSFFFLFVFFFSLLGLFLLFLCLLGLLLFSSVAFLGIVRRDPVHPFFTGSFNNLNSNEQH